VVGLALVIAAATLAAALVAGEYVALPAMLTAIPGLVGDERLLALVGLIGGTLQTLILSLSGISMTDVNASRYRGMLRQLDEIAATYLPAAEKAAASLGADPAPIEDFWQALALVLSQENAQWQELVKVLPVIILQHSAAAMRGKS
jgi:hypothetical protein